MSNFRPVVPVVAALATLSACGADDTIPIAEIIEALENERERSDDPPSPPPPPMQGQGGSGPIGEPSHPERAAVQAILDDNCGNCHNPQAGFGAVFSTDIDYLVERGLIVPGDAYESAVAISMQQRRMPPPSVLEPRPSDDDIERVADFIDAME